MRHLKRIMALAMMINLASRPPAWSLGLAARFGDVIIENAAIGRTYNLREATRVPLGLQNLGETEVEVSVDFAKPAPDRMVKGYESIPDPSWLKAIPAKLKIGPKAVGFVDILLAIPDDPAINGKHFEALIKAQTEGTGLFGVSIENRLRFSIGPGPDTLKEEKRQKAMAQLDFDVSPQALYVIDVPVGKKFNVKREQNKTVRVANFSADPLEIRFTSDKWDARLYLPNGYEPIPDPGWITFKKTDLKIEGGKIATFDFNIEIPKDEKYAGKNYAALLRTGLTTGYWLDAPVRVYITTKEIATKGETK